MHTTGDRYFNCDGFGIGWYTDAQSQFQNKHRLESEGQDQRNEIRNIFLDTRPALYKTTLANPWVVFYSITFNAYLSVFRRWDPVFVSLCDNIASHCIVAHMRATLGTDSPASTTNNHPFVFGRHSFMYNGDISGFGKIVSPFSPIK